MTGLVSFIKSNVYLKVVNQPVLNTVKVQRHDAEELLHQRSSHQKSEHKMDELIQGPSYCSNFGRLCEGQVSYTKSFKQSSLLQ